MLWHLHRKFVQRGMVCMLSQGGRAAALSIANTATTQSLLPMLQPFSFFYVLLVAESRSMIYVDFAYLQINLDPTEISYLLRYRPPANQKVTRGVPLIQHQRFTDIYIYIYSIVFGTPCDGISPFPLSPAAVCRTSPGTRVADHPACGPSSAACTNR